jgi:hypothetical protein
MKDLTKYIRTLIDEVDIPSEIRLQEDGVYRIDVNVDLKGSWVLYKINYERDNKDVRNIRVQLKKYLPQLEFVVKVNYINYPNRVTIPILNEYKIRPREHYNNLLKLKDMYSNQYDKDR